MTISICSQLAIDTKLIYDYHNHLSKTFTSPEIYAALSSEKRNRAQWEITAHIIDIIRTTTLHKVFHSLILCCPQIAYLQRMGSNCLRE